jgi:hypothetical protein
VGIFFELCFTFISPVRPYREHEMYSLRVSCCVAACWIVLTWNSVSKIMKIYKES